MPSGVGVRRTATADEWSGLTGSVTILLYHAVARAGESRSRFVVGGPEFAWQMRWLARGGYRVVSLGSYVRDRHEHRLTPGRSVIITFDDGYADNGAVAAPILAAQHFGATIFLVTDRVGDANRWDAEGALAGRPILSWGEIRALERAGLEFAPHGRSHRAMTDLSDEELSDEIGGAWETLKQEVAHPVPVFAFPFGLHDPSARNASEKAGLIAACTATRGRSDSPDAPECAPSLRNRGYDQSDRLPVGRVVRRELTWMSGVPTVSVVTCFLNPGRYLDETIESVLSQSTDGWELLLVDDGSTDGSTEIAQRYASEYPQRIFYLEHPDHENRGCSASRNLALRHARGEFVGILDADDVLLQQALERRIGILRARP